MIKSLYFKDKVCEVCGEPATTAIRDDREIPSESGYRCFEPDGNPHLFCDKCRREPRRVYL